MEAAVNSNCDDIKTYKCHVFVLNDAVDWLVLVKTLVYAPFCARSAEDLLRVVV